MLKLGYDVSEEIILLSFSSLLMDKKLLTHSMCAYSPLRKQIIILSIINVTENLALSAQFRYEKINAGSKINAGLK